MKLDDDAKYRAVSSRDRRFDGVFYTAVHTTGIYCRPSCPARTPHRVNVSFYRSAAAAQGAGFRACRRCLPDATPGSPEWDLDADAADRAMRLINDGEIERSGVPGLAARLGFSERQVNRLVNQHWGAGPLALARARRAQTARVLVESSDLSMADVAFAAGFSSIRSFNDTLREVYAATPTELRGRSRRGTATKGRYQLRLAVREPFAGGELLEFLATRALPGVEWVEGTSYERSLRLPHGQGVLRVELGDRPDRVVPATLWLGDVRDLSPALERSRRLLDADCDPLAVEGALGQSPFLAPLVAARPGLRTPGHVDGVEVAVRAIVGQQVSVAGARTLVSRLVDEHGADLALASADDQTESDGPRVTRLFPTVEQLADLDPASIAMPRARGRALASVMTELVRGEIHLDRSMDRGEVRARLLALSGIGPWTADYIAMRALGEPDAFLPTDVGIRQAAVELGIGDLRQASESWRPWRSYASLHLWAELAARHSSTITANPTISKGR